MATTRLIAESVMVGADKLSGRLGRRAAFAKLYVPGTSTIGAIPAVGAMLGEGLASLGIHAADPSDPQAGDFAQVQDAQRAQLFDVAELRGLYNIVGNLDELDEQDGDDRRDFTKFAEHVAKRAAELAKTVQAAYGYGGQAPTIGLIGLNFQESGNPDDWRVDP